MDKNKKKSCRFTRDITRQHARQCFLTQTKPDNEQNEGRNLNTVMIN